ncbi:MAG TPA: DNA-formamidopyrimidine glycosylase family protein [Kofleriaceae bacterium]|nr:DNA-formamidopyrimidine glycosylase family protein [Kofleriaceae bacterium]
MPELPDVTVYVERLRAFLVGKPLRAIRISSPFVLRSVDPQPGQLVGKTVTGAHRIGKRIVIEFEDDLFAVIHLMIAGRLKWRKAKAPFPGKLGLAAFDFDHGTVLFTEASKKKRASLHVVCGRDALKDFDRGGLDVFTSTDEQFSDALKEDNHTIKRALTDPTVLDGIGNAYSDEILWRAKMSPFKQTRQLSDDEMHEVHEAAKASLTEWTDRLRQQVGDGFPEEVTAFRPEMAVHGKYRQPCPRCGSPVQRIVYADNEANYCATCQTGGRLLADRALSRLLKANWPKTLEELEERRKPRPA